MPKCVTVDIEGSSISLRIAGAKLKIKNWEPVLNNMVLVIGKPFLSIFQVKSN